MSARPRSWPWSTSPWSVLLGREHWAEVTALAAGDAGARAFLRARPDLVTLVECGDTGSPDDIDTTEDLARIAGLLQDEG
jgi:CTP:molybdopterin cytidylyltransferase MocA